MSQYEAVERQRWELACEGSPENQFILGDELFGGGGLGDGEGGRVDVALFYC
jgi:hypothetical protein